MKYKFVAEGKASKSKSSYQVCFLSNVKDLGQSSFPEEAKTGLKILITRNKYEAKNGQVLSFDLVKGSTLTSYVIVGLEESLQVESTRRAAAAFARYLRNNKEKQYNVSINLLNIKEESHVTALVEGMRLASYRFEKYKSEAVLPNSSVQVGLASSAKNSVVNGAIKKGDMIYEAVSFARDLINESPSVIYPESLGVAAKKELTKLGMKVQVFNQAWLKQKKMGGILAVGQGSVKKPVLIEVSYKPKKATKKHLVFVGKGVTFDSGGLSIKVGGSMVNMKMDMGGAGAVLGAMKLIGLLKPNVNVTALIPSVENMPDGNSYRVDDVLTMGNGSTVEINNTDAEGRLILADALYWATTKKPDVIVDVATLTGACAVALGQWTAGLFSNDESIASKLLASSEKSGEKLGRLPLDKDMAESLNSYLADQKNTAGIPQGGAITAALFLEKFVKNTPWAHLDIAGLMKAAGDQHLFDGGSTGFGVRLLADFAQSF